MLHSQRSQTSVIALRSLGECVIEADKKQIGPSSSVTFALLLRLLVEPGQRLARSEVQALLWPDVPNSEARHRLRQMIYTIKRDGFGLSADRINVRLVARSVAVDFRDAIANCTQSFGPLLQEFLPKYSPSISVAFDRWVETLREQVNLQIRTALLTAIAVQRQNGRWSDVEAAATRCLAIDPLNEEATLALAEARAMGGNKLEAVRLLDCYTEDVAVRTAKIALPGALLRERITDRLVPLESPVVGRESTIAEITTMVRHLGRGNGGGGYLIFGGAGMGKTRIVEEVMQTAALADITIVHTECPPSEAQCPLSVFTRIAPAIQALPGSIGCSPSSLEYIKRLTDRLPNAPADRTDTDPPSFVYRSIKRSILDLIAAVTHEVKLLLVIDDIDQADEQSTEVVADLLAERHSAMLLLMTGRDAAGPIARLTAVNRGLRSHALRPLNRRDSTNLLRDLTARHHGGLDEGQQALYVEMAHGNPQCIRELARYWESCGHLHPIPPSIESALEQRVSSLSGTELATLQMIVLLGRHATAKRLARLLNASTPETLERIERLEKMGFARCDCGAVKCVHSAIGDLACGKLSSTALVSLHGEIAELLRADLDAPRDSRMLWDCANHYRLAGLHREAIDLLSSCSDRLSRLGLPQEAVSIWDRAIGWCRSDEERVLVQEKLIPALRAAGDLARVSRTAEEITRLRTALELGDSRWSAWRIDALEAKMYALEDVEPILIEAAACLADESTAPALRVRAGICAMICAYNLHDATRFIHFNKILVAFADDGALRPVDRLTISLLFNTYVGDLDTGDSAGSGLVALARDSGSLAFLAQSLRRHAMVLRLLGKFSDAYAALSEAAQLEKSMCSRSLELATLALMAQTFFDKGDLESARDLLDGVLTAEDRRRYPYRAIAIAELKAQIAFATGDRKKAIRICDSRAFRKWRTRSAQSGGRKRVVSLAMSALLSVSKGRQERSKKQLMALEVEFARLQSFGDQDWPAFAVCRSWLALGQPNHAQTILLEYLRRHRRERSPAPDYLTSLLKLEREPRVTSSCNAMGAI